VVYHQHPDSKDRVNLLTENKCDGFFPNECAIFVPDENVKVFYFDLGINRKINILKTYLMRKAHLLCVKQDIMYQLTIQLFLWDLVMVQWYFHY
jgi:hypothetical protein